MSSIEHITPQTSEESWQAHQEKPMAADRLFFGYTHTEFLNGAAKSRFEDEPRFIVYPAMHQKFLESTEEHLVRMADLSVRPIRQLEQSQIQAMSDAVEAFHPPDFLLNSFDARTGRELVQNVLSTPVVKDTQPRISNYFEWATAASLRRQADFEKHEAPRMLDIFGQYLELGVGDGVIPAAAKKRFEAMHEQGQFRIEETLGVALKSIDSHKTVHAYARKYTDHSALIRINLADPGDRMHTFVHEGLHAITGVNIAHEETGEVAFQNYGLGRVFGDSNLGRLITEAVTEQAADSLINGNADVVDPSSAERVASAGTYTAGRYLLNTLCNRGLKPIDPRLFTHALFEDDTNEGHGIIKKLAKQLDRSFPGMNVVQRIRDFDTPEEYSDLAQDLAIVQFAIELEAEAQEIPKGIGRRVIQKMISTIAQEKEPLA
ncbi:MAG TPA: hypothetical protein VK978_01290 [Candidatus Saccharimonadales bacterium]|nr:hypothetical protein [Candidatus Saccharimonadales bacterium]